jgi:predicted small secreted protein
MGVMVKALKFIGVVGIAAAAAVVTTAVLTDETTRGKVVSAVDKVKNAAREVASTVADGIEQARKEGSMTPAEKNQAWADEQWEALGI